MRGWATRMSNSHTPGILLSSEDTKRILCETLDRLKQRESAYSTAVREAGNDMIKYMRVVFPLATKIQMEVLCKHGCTGDGEDLVRFTQLVKQYERHDEQIALLNSQLRSLILPHMDVIRPPSTNVLI